MYLITFTYEISEENQDAFIQSISKLKDFWKSQGLPLALYRDMNHKTRIQLTFLTERTVDEITRLIQESPKARILFEKIKTCTGHIVVSVYDKLI